MEKLREVLVNDWKKIVKRSLFALTVAIVSCFYPIVNQHREPLRVLNTFVDDAIPFNQFFIIPYVSWYGYVTLFIIILCILDEDSYMKLIFTLVIGMLISFVIFINFPTYTPRPVIMTTDPFSKLVLEIYEADKPYNCFPSAHVLYSMLIAIYVAESKALSKSTKYISSVVCILIILSTMFIKQHFFLDAVSAVLISVLLYLLTNIIWGKRIKHF